MRVREVGVGLLKERGVEDEEEGVGVVGRKGEEEGEDEEGGRMVG